MLCNISAINKLLKDVLTKTDGFVNVGTPDKNDFIVKCPAQTTGVGFWARLFGKKNRNCLVTFHHSYKRMTPAAGAGSFKH